MDNTFRISALRRNGMPPDAGIDWEFQPSLQHLVVRTESAHDETPTWVETMPASFDSFSEPTEFLEPMQGLSVRDIDEPEIFRVFFGDGDRPVSRA